MTGEHLSGSFLVTGSVGVRTPLPRHPSPRPESSGAGHTSPCRQGPGPAGECQPLTLSNPRKMVPSLYYSNEFILDI